MIRLVSFAVRHMFLLAGVALVGCELPPPPPAERRSISYEYPSVEYGSVPVLRGGKNIQKKYLSVDWNLPPSSDKTTQQAIKECVTALRTETSEKIARRIGLPKLSMDYVVILVFRDKENETGVYEYGLVVPLSVLFSNKNSEELLEIGRSSTSPVGTKSDGNWDFGWAMEQVSSAYQDDGI